MLLTSSAGPGCGCGSGERLQLPTMSVCTLAKYHCKIDVYLP